MQTWPVECQLMDSELRLRKKYLKEKVERTPTIGVNVVNAGDRGTLNLFIDGRATHSFPMETTMTLGEAVIWLGTQLQLREIKL